jgi:CRP/FNR family transcriptional regulator, cyclic AMP receptor protein
LYWEINASCGVIFNLGCIAMMEFSELVQALQTLKSEDAFRPRLNLDQWKMVGTYLTRHEVRMGDLLIKQGDGDRSMYFLGSGTLQVFMTGGPPGSHKVAILRPGAVVGELGIFVDGPRTANVEAMTNCEVWALRGTRLEELAQRLPALALELVRAAGAVMAVRMRGFLHSTIPPAAR